MTEYWSWAVLEFPVWSPDEYWAGMVGPRCPNHYTSLSKTCQRGWVRNTRRLVLFQNLGSCKTPNLVYLDDRIPNSGTSSRAEGAGGQTKLQTNSKDTRDVSGMNTITSGLLQDDPNEHIIFFSEIPRYLGISGKKLICWLGDHSSSPLVPVL